jgi:DNA polymerase-4/DNA polymerase V
MSYAEMARRIKAELEGELGLTFSVGLSVNKVAAKIASKWRKPAGLTIIPGRSLPEYLARLPLGTVWGIGPNTTAHLAKLGLIHALDFAKRDEQFVARHFSKPYVDIWRELRGEFVLTLSTEPKRDYQSVSKTRTFTPPSSDRAFLYSQLSKNVENACIKLRRHTHFATELFFYLKTQDFRYHGLELKLSRGTAVPQEVMAAVREHFDSVWRPRTLYRATGIVLTKLSHDAPRTLDLFGASLRAEKLRAVYDVLDGVATRYGKHTIFLGSSFLAMREAQHGGERGTPASRKRHLLKGETARQRLGLPYLGSVR